MEMFDITLWPPTAWHWLAVGLLLIAIEMGIGTFDLLWISIAAGITSAFTAFGPEAVTGWQGQLIVFAITSVIMVIIGRTVFRSIREGTPEHPTLNKRMASTVGSKGTVASAFEGGMGRVKLGDTEWSAETIDGSNPGIGAGVRVEETDGNKLRVRVV